MRGMLRRLVEQATGVETSSLRPVWQPSAVAADVNPGTTLDLSEDLFGWAERRAGEAPAGKSRDAAIPSSADAQRRPAVPQAMSPARHDPPSPPSSRPRNGARHREPRSVEPRSGTQPSGGIERLLPFTADTDARSRRGRSVPDGGVRSAPASIQRRRPRVDAEVPAGGHSLSLGVGANEPEIHVRIGRLHVTAGGEDVAPLLRRDRPKAPEPTSLAEHLSRRTGRQ